MKLVLSARLVDSVVKSASSVVVHVMSKLPLIEKAIGKKGKSEAEVNPLAKLANIPFFFNLEEKFESKGFRAVRTEEELILEVNDDLLIDCLQPVVTYANGIVDLLPNTIKAIREFDKQAQDVNDKWKHVEGFDFVEFEPATLSETPYKYLDVDGKDVVIEPSKIQELLENLKVITVEAVSQRFNIPKNVLIALQREYLNAFN